MWKPKTLYLKFVQIKWVKLSMIMKHGMWLSNWERFYFFVFIRKMQMWIVKIGQLWIIKATIYSKYVQICIHKTSLFYLLPHFTFILFMIFLNFLCFLDAAFITWRYLKFIRFLFNGKVERKSFHQKHHSFLWKWEILVNVFYAMLCVSISMASKYNLHSSEKLWGFKCSFNKYGKQVIVKKLSQLMMG